MNKTLPSSLLPLLMVVPALPVPVAAQSDDLLVVENLKDLAARNRLLARMRKITVSVNFEDATAKDIVKYLQIASGGTVNFIVSSKTAKADDLPRVTLALKSVNLANVMSVIEDQIDLRFTFKSGLVFLKPKDEVKELAYLRMYDVRAAVMAIPNFKPPRLGLRPPGEEFDEGDDDEEPKPLLFDSDRLVDLVKSNVVAESWDKEGISIDAMRGVLLVRQTVKGHRAVRDLLIKLGAIPAPRRVVARRPWRLPTRRPAKPPAKPAAKKPAKSPAKKR